MKQTMMMVLSCLKDCRKLSPIFDYQKYMGKNKKEKKDFLSNNIDTGAIFPIAKRIMARTIAQDLVSVQPMDGLDSKTRDKIKAEVKATNRERKIESVLEDKPFEEMKIQEHPEWKGGPNFVYGGTASVI